jgi:cobalamin-dependent methionine synthase I
MLGPTEPRRERVLLVGVEGDEHTLELEMVRDQLAAAGYQTIFDTDLSAERLRTVVEAQSPDVIVLGTTVVAAAAAVEQAVKDLRTSHPEIPIVLGGAAVGRRVPQGMRVLERIDESVEAVENLLTTPTASR